MADNDALLDELNKLTKLNSGAASVELDKLHNKLEYTFTLIWRFLVGLDEVPAWHKPIDAIDAAFRLMWAHRGHKRKAALAVIVHAMTCFNIMRMTDYDFDMHDATLQLLCKEMTAEERARAAVLVLNIGDERVRSRAADPHGVYIGAQAYTLLAARFLLDKYRVIDLTAFPAKPNLRDDYELIRGQLAAAMQAEKNKDGKIDLHVLSQAIQTAFGVSEPG